MALATSQIMKNLLTPFIAYSKYNNILSYSVIDFLFYFVNCMNYLKNFSSSSID